MHPETKIILIDLNIVVTPTLRVWIIMQHEEIMRRLNQRRWL